MAITVAVLKEAPGERRVALVPAVVKRLVKQGCSVMIETGAGEAAEFSDQQYTDAGAQVAERAKVLEKANLLAVVNQPDEEVLKGPGPTRPCWAFCPFRPTST